MGIYIYDATRRVATPLSVDLRRRQVSELTPVAASVPIHRHQGEQTALPYAGSSGFNQADQSHSEDGSETGITASATALPSAHLVARQVMTPNPLSIASDTDWQEARHLMLGHGIHHLLVSTQQGDVVGLVKQSDLTHFPDECGTPPNELPIRPLLIVTPDTDVSIVALLMLERNQDAVAVATGSSLLGIVTQQDMLKALIQAEPVEGWA